MLLSAAHACQDAAPQATSCTLEAAAEPADKLRHTSLPKDIRILLPKGGSQPVWMHKDPIDWGTEAQIFAGVQDGRPVVLRRLNALDHHTTGGCRDKLTNWRHRQALARCGADATVPRLQAFEDTLALADITHDVEVTGRVAALRHQPFSALSTRRAPQGPIAKIFELIVPRQGDLLEVIIALRGRNALVRAAVAGVCIGSLAQDLGALAAHGIAHGDLREENVLLRVAKEPQGPCIIESSDFGYAHQTAEARGIAPQEQAALARLIVVMLAPEQRVALRGQPLGSSAALAQVTAQAPGWGALVRDLLAGRMSEAAAIARALAELGAAAPEALPLARPVLSEVSAKASELGERLAHLAAYAVGREWVGDASVAQNPFRVWPASWVAAAQARVEDLLAP